MSHTAALEWATAAAVLLSAAHLVSPAVRRWSEARTQWFAPVSAGALAAYIFLHLLPSLGESETAYGIEVTAAALVGFVLYHAVEVVTDEDRGRLVTARIAIAWLYSFLIVYSLPATIEESPLAALVSTVALATHVVHTDSRLSRADAARFDRSGRWVLATAPLAAVAIDVVSGQPDPQIATFLSAFASGVLLVGLFRDTLGDGVDPRALPWFLAGVAGFGAVFVLEATLG